MNKRTTAGLLMLAAVMAGPPREVQAQTRPASPAPAIEYGTRVQVVSPRLGTAWHTGVVGRVGACLAVMIPDGENPTHFTVVRFDEATRLRVAEGRASATRWTEVPVAPLRERHAGCTPF